MVEEGWIQGGFPRVIDGVAALRYLESKDRRHFPRGGKVEGVFLGDFTDEEVVEKMPIIFHGRFTVGYRSYE